MTRELIERMVALWIPVLGLAHWKIDVDWTKDVGPLGGALTSWEDDYDVATLAFEPGFTEWTTEYAEWTVVHELLHLVVRDLDAATTATHALLPKAARQLAEARWKHEVEGVVDRVAGSLVAVSWVWRRREEVTC